MGFVLPADMDSARYIATHLREADRRECMALVALPPELVIPQVVASGARVWSFHTEAGEPVGLYGVNPTPTEGVGEVWMCSTPTINSHAREFLIESRPYVMGLHDDFPILTNLVDARNTVHHRWLKWLGFVFLRRIEKWGAASVPFYEFARLKQTCA